MPKRDDSPKAVARRFLIKHGNKNNPALQDEDACWLIELDGVIDLIRASRRRRAVRLTDRYCGPLRDRAFIKELKRAILGACPRKEKT